MAVIFQEMGNYKDSIEMYYECLKVFKNYKDKRTRICILFNIAKLQNKPSKMFKLIEIYKDLDLNVDGIVKYTNEEKVQIIADMQKELFDLLIGNVDYQGAFKLVHSAVDAQLKKEMVAILRNRTLIA